MNTPSTSSTVRDEGWRAFMVLACIEFLTVMDASIVNIVLPVMRADLGLTTSEAAWIVNSYLVPFAGLLLTAGRLSDVVGRRRLFLVGTVAFTIASMMCAVSSVPWQLFVGRAFQGAAAALVVPSALALISSVFRPGPGRVRALGIFSGMAGIAGPVGLVFGGLLAEIDWHLIFWINAPVGLLVVIGAAVWVPAPPRSSTAFDAVAALAATAMLALLCFAAISVESNGLSDPATVAAAAAAAAAAGTFVVRQRLSRQPLIPTGVLKSPGMLWSTAIFAVVGSSLLGTFYIVTLYLQNIRVMDPLHATLVYVPVPLAMLAGTQLAPRAISKYDVRNVLAAGLLLQFVGLALWRVASGETTDLLTTHLVPILIWALGLGMSILSSFVACTSSVAESLAGAASGLATTAYQGGGAVGLSIMAAIAASHTAAARGEALSGFHGAVGALALTTALAALMTRALPRTFAPAR